MDFALLINGEGGIKCVWKRAALIELTRKWLLNRQMLCNTSKVFSHNQICICLSICPPFPCSRLISSASIIYPTVQATTEYNYMLENCPQINVRPHFFRVVRRSCIACSLFASCFDLFVLVWLCLRCIGMYLYVSLWVCRLLLLCLRQCPPSVRTVR